MGQFEIMRVKAREILADSNIPTVEAEMCTKGGIVGRATCPLGTRPLEHEAFQLRDGDERYAGLGVQKAVRNVNEVIGPKLVGKDVTRQNEIDDLMVKLDGTENKSKLGANAILAVSLATAVTAAKALEFPLYRYVGGVNANLLPIPIAGIIGSYSIDGFQEHLIMPVAAASYSDALRMDVEVSYEYKDLLERAYGKKLRYDDNIPSASSRETLDRMLDAIEKAGYANRFKFCLDCAATHFYNKDKKRYFLEGKERTTEDMTEFYKELVRSYPIFSVEDPLYRDDFEGHATLTKELGIQVVGDDLLVTNVKRLQKAIDMSAVNALLLKPNQIGTLTETLDAVELAQRNRLKVMVSGRARMFEDTIADITVAINCGQIKPGPMGKRNYIYNRFLEIEEELGDSAKYPKSL